MLLNPSTLLQVYESLPVASCLISRSLSFIAANKRYADLMRTPLESIVGRSMIGFNPLEHITNVRRDFEAFDQGRLVKDHEIQLWDGTYLVCVCPVYNSTKESVMAISVTLTNITRHKNLETHLTGLIGKLMLENEDIRHLSETDALTTLGNRRAFDSYLDNSIRNAQRTGQTLSLLIIDVDNFKSYNDLYGHPNGDQCLQRIAEHFSRSLLRPDDMAARYGGEEFVAILPNTHATGAVKVANFIRSNITLMSIPHSGSAHGIVTVSIGIASYAPRSNNKINSSEIAKHLLERADAALYRAKQSGRNKVMHDERTLDP